MSFSASRSSPDSEHCHHCYFDLPAEYSGKWEKPQNQPNLSPWTSSDVIRGSTRHENIPPLSMVGLDPTMEKFLSH